MKQYWKSVLRLLPAVVLMLSLTACEDDVTEPSLTDFEVVNQAIVTWLGGSPAPAIAPSTVYDDLVGSGNYSILSVRAESAYDIGHIEGATRVGWNEVYSSAVTSTLSTSATIVVYCYTGHTGGIAAATLGIMGFDTENLKWGMMNWTDEATVLGTTAFSSSYLSGTDGLETTANALGTTEFNYPDLEVSTSDDATVIVQKAAERFLIGAAGSALITSAEAVFGLINDGDTTNDPIIISVRSATDYAAGHVPGAINLAKTDLTDLEVLNKLDPSKDIVVYCYTGHTAGQATVILNMLGYNARNLKFGMMGWNTDGNPEGAAYIFTAAPGYPTVATGGN